MRFSDSDYQTLKLHLRAAILLMGITPAVARVHSPFEGRSDEYFNWEMFWRSKWSVTNAEAFHNYNSAHMDTAIRKALKELGAEPELLTTPLPFTREALIQQIQTYTRMVLPFELTHIKPGGFTFHVQESKWHKLPTQEQAVEVVKQLAQVFKCFVTTSIGMNGWMLIFTQEGVSTAGSWQGAKLETGPLSIFIEQE